MHVFLFILWTGAGVSRNDFWTFGNGNGNGSAHSQTLGTGTGMINCIPNFWEREWKFHSQFLGMGTGMEIPFPNFGNGNETMLFPGMIGKGNENGIAKLSEPLSREAFFNYRGVNEIFSFLKSHVWRQEWEFISFSLMLWEENKNFNLSVSC